MLVGEVQLLQSGQATEGQMQVSYLSQLVLGNKRHAPTYRPEWILVELQMVQGFLAFSRSQLK